VVSGTQHALMALEKLETKRALAILQDVSGKLDILHAKFPGLNLIPANVEAEVIDFEGNSKQIQKLVDKADQLLTRQS
jgi:YfdX protein